MKNWNVVLATAMAAGLAMTASGQVAFTPDNLVVLRVGDGAASLTNAATPVFIEEISPFGALVQTIAMPTVAATSGNRAATTSGTATSEGALNRSADGRFITYGGYNADVGTAGIASTTSSTVSRVAARIAADGTIDTTTAFTDDTYSGSNIRSVITDDGTQFWMSGNGSPASGGGVRYAALGSESSIQLSAAPTNTRVVNIFDGQLYVSTQSGAYRGLNMVGTGLPTEAGQFTTRLPGFDAISINPQEFFFADIVTIYVADERSAAAGGGVQRWDHDGFAWQLTYTMQTGLGSGARGITGAVEAAGMTIYVTTSENPTIAAGNRLMRVIDSGEFSEFVLIATAPANTVFRSVAFAPQGEVAPACYANCDNSTTEPILNVDDFTCFINAFAAAQSLPHEEQITSYANCDNSTTAPVLNVDDFTCFINEFAAGCP